MRRQSALGDLFIHKYAYYECFNGYRLRKPVSWIVYLAGVTCKLLGPVWYVLRQMIDAMKSLGNRSEFSFE